MDVRQVIANIGELAEPQGQAVVENLAMVDEQLGRPAVNRDDSKIERALKLLPGLLSLVPAFAKAWETLELLIRQHLQQ